MLEQQPEGVNRGCTYELSAEPSKPAFMYSKGPGAVNWLDGELKLLGVLSRPAQLFEPIL